MQAPEHKTEVVLSISDKIERVVFGLVSAVFILAGIILIGGILCMPEHTYGNVIEWAMWGYEEAQSVKVLIVGIVLVRIGFCALRRVNHP